MRHGSWHGTNPCRFARVLDIVFPAKPTNWCPNPLLFLGGLFLSFLAILSLPYAAETSSFNTVLLLTRATNLALVAMPSIVPVSWGTVHPHPHDAYSTYNSLFRIAASLSLLLHAKASVAAVLFNVPDPYYHRHSIRIPFDTAERSTWERSTGAVGKGMTSRMFPG